MRTSTDRRNLNWIEVVLFQNGANIFSLLDNDFAQPLMIRVWFYRSFWRVFIQQELAEWIAVNVLKKMRVRIMSDVM